MIFAITVGAIVFLFVYCLMNYSQPLSARESYEALSPPTPSRPPITWDIMQHQGWGDQISWFDYQRMRLTGHTPILRPRPEPGDILLCPMQSGKIGKFRFVRLEHKSDPPDMWFADMKPIEEE